MTALSGEDEEMLVVGVISLSNLASCSSKISSCGSRTLEKEAGGNCLLFFWQETLGILDNCWWQAVQEPQYGH